MTCIRDYGTLATTTRNTNNDDSSLAPSDLVPFIGRQITVFTQCPSEEGSCFRGILTDVFPDSIKLVCNRISPVFTNSLCGAGAVPNVSPLTRAVVIVIDKITCIKFPTI